MHITHVAMNVLSSLKSTLVVSLSQRTRCRERVQTAVDVALRAVSTVQDTYSNMVADLNITIEELLTQFDGASLEQYAERLDFYKQQINLVNNNTSTQVKRLSYSSFHSNHPLCVFIFYI